LVLQKLNKPTTQVISLQGYNSYIDVCTEVSRENRAL